MIKRLLTTITFVILIISSNAQTNSSDTLFVFQEGEALEDQYGSEDITYSQKIDRAFTPIAIL